MAIRANLVGAHRSHGITRYFHFSCESIKACGRLLGSEVTNVLDSIIQLE